MTDLVDEEKSLAKRNGLLLLKALRQNLGLHHTPPQESKPHKSSCYALFRKIKRHNSSSYARTRQTKAHHTRQQQLEHVICITPTNRQIKPHNSTTAAGIIYIKKKNGHYYAVRRKTRRHGWWRRKQRQRQRKSVCTTPHIIEWLHHSQSFNTACLVGVRHGMAAPGILAGI